MTSGLDEKLMPLDKQTKKNNQSNNTTSTSNVKKHRFLIIVNVLGSAGPIKYVVNIMGTIALQP